MTIRFVTTCHKAGLDQYGHRLLANRDNLPGELVWYTEGYTLDGVQAKDNTQLPELQAFKERYRNYVAPGFSMDVVRFSHKVYAFVDALKDHDDLGVWIDADCVPYAQIPEQYVRGQLPEGKYIAMFQRKGMYSECGYWVVDCRNPSHPAFMDAMRRMYTDDGFRNCREWHDSYLMDVVVKNLKLDVHNLSNTEVMENQTHIMALSDIARYIDHTKGSDRKQAGFSGENTLRKKAIESENTGIQRAA